MTTAAKPVGVPVPELAARTASALLTSLRDARTLHRLYPEKTATIDAHLDEAERYARELFLYLNAEALKCMR